MRFLARFFIVLLLPIALYLLPIQSAHAQYSNPYTTPNTDANVPANLHTYTQSLIIEIMAALACQITGQDPTTASHECLGFNPATGRLGYADLHGGAIGAVNNMITALYTPPIDTVGYVRYVASNFGLVKHSFASGPGGSGVVGCGSNGCGFDKLTPILGLWTTFRNISYAVFVIIFVAIGFAIMLRVQIDPRTVMTIENQIPKIVIALILVTFSYAISGFLIDLMYAATYLSINVVASSQASDTKYLGQIRTTEINQLTGGNPLTFADNIIPGGIVNIAGGAAAGAGKVVQGFFPQPKDQSDPGKGWLIGGGTFAATTAACVGVSIWFTAGLSIVPCLLLGAASGTIAGWASSGGFRAQVIDALSTVLGFVTNILAFLVVVIALLVALFRVWFTLLLAYVSILLEIVLAPFYIIFGIFPGSKIGFGSWFKSIVGNLLAFPVTVVFFLLAGVFMNNFATNSRGMFVPPLIGNPNGGSGQSPVAYLIALGMILLAPNVVSLTRGLVGAGENKALGGIFQGIGVGGKTVGGIFKRTTGAVFGEQITYDENGTPKRIDNPVEKLWRGFVQH